MTFDRKSFEKERQDNALRQASDHTIQKKATDLLAHADQHGYLHQWDWLGVPIIQSPEDIVATQEIIWKHKPDFIIETGIAWGGSVVLYASILELIGKGEVIAIDCVLPQKNIDTIKAYSFSKRIHLFEGSSVEPSVFGQVKTLTNRMTG